jgi:hypothetical protein
MFTVDASTVILKKIEIEPGVAGIRQHLRHSTDNTLGVAGTRLQSAKRDPLSEKFSSDI